MKPHLLLKNIQKVRRPLKHRPHPVNAGQAGVDQFGTARWLPLKTQATPEVAVLQAYKTDPWRDPPPTSGQFSSAGMIFEPPWLCAVAVVHDGELKGRACLGWSFPQLSRCCWTWKPSAKASPVPSPKWPLALLSPRGEILGTQGSQASLLEGRMEKKKGVLNSNLL